MTRRRTGPFALAALLLLAATPAVAQEDTETPPGEAAALSVVTAGTTVVDLAGRRAEVPWSETAMGPLFAAAPIVALAGGSMGPGPGGAGERIAVGETVAIVAAGNSMATIGREVLRLPQPPRLGDGGLQVPLELLRRLLGEIGLEISWDPALRSLQVGRTAEQAVEVGWNLVHLQGLSTLVLEFPVQPRYRVIEEEGRWTVELPGVRPVPRETTAVAGDPLVRNLRFQENGIVIDTVAGTVAEHYEQSRPFRLVFDVYRRQATDLGPGADDPEAPAADGRMTIVIDPGHGGSATGAIGPGGIEEKTLTLEIAQRLRRELQSRLPVRVVLTREEDADLPHDTRAAIANQHKADLFVSLHLNSSLGPTAHGAETYFLSLEASDAAAAASVERERGPVAAGDPSDELALILWDLAQSAHLAESQRFATLVQEELNQSLGLRDRGVKQAPFRVLMGAGMPAVLVELGFVSNPEEETRLQTPGYQEELVDALVRAVARYRRQADETAVAGNR